MTDQPTPQDTPDGGGLREFLETKPGVARLAGALLIVVLTTIAYIPAINGLFIWDDNHHVLENELLLDWEGLGRIWTDIFPNPEHYPLPQYYPLTHTSFWLEYQLWGHGPDGVPRPMPFHITNIVLHICSAMLIWLILSRLSLPGSWFAAALFALHPIQAETVSWISERKNCLGIFFFLCSLYVYLRYAGIIVSGGGRPNPDGLEKESTFSLPSDPTRLFVLATILFLCALWSKTITQSMPAVALVIIWWKRGLSLADFKSAIPLLLVGAGMGMLTGYMEYTRVGVSQRPQFWDFAATPAGEIGARLIIAGRVVWFYITKLLVPFPLIFNYPRWAIDPGNVVMYLFPISVLAILITLVLMARRIGKGPAAGALIFVGTLFPALGFVDVWPMQYSFVADHFVYLSSIAFFATAAALLRKYLSLEGFAGVAVCAMLIFSAMAFGHARNMSELKLLWEDTLRKTNNRSWFALNNYGVLIRDSDFIPDFHVRMDEAEKRFLKVIELKPDHPESRVNLAAIAQRRALVAQMEAQSPGVPVTQPTVRLATSQPTTRAREYFDQAINYYQEAIRLQPNLVPAHYELANLLAILGRRQEALEHFRKCVEIYPRHTASLQVLADHALLTGRADEAVQYLQTLVELLPRSPRVHADYGWALLQAGNVVGGFAEWEVTLGMAPEDPRFANEFGIRMAQAGDFRRASEYFRIANNINPNSVDIVTNLGIAAARLGQPVAAKMLLESALKMDPNFATAKQAMENFEAGRLGPATTQSSTQPTSGPATIPTSVSADIQRHISDLLRYSGHPGARPSDLPATAAIPAR